MLIFLWQSCSDDNSAKLLPESNGRTHDILVIMDNQDWKKELGDSIRKYFAAEYTDLPQSEPVFTLHQAAPDLYNGIFKVIRNVIVVKTGDHPGVRTYTDRYASPQLITVFEAKNKEELKKLISQNALKILKKYAVSEIVNQQRLHRKSLRNNEDIEKEFGIKIDIPDFFNLVDHKKGFMWFRRDLKTGEEDLVFYEVKLKDSLSFSPDEVTCYRDSIGMKFIPGPTDGTYMNSYTDLSPSQEITELGDHKAIETRGLWNIQNDFMGGPYINYNILDKKHNRILVAEGFVYAPAKDKRDYIVQLESILKTIKFKD